jgi:energy-coupling factor transport system substrate-specific component
MLTTPRLIVIALCAALNFSIGTIVYLIKLPIYLDSIGTILCALLLASDRKVAFVCAWLAATSSTIISVVINPYIPWFALTDLTIALVSAFATATAAATFRARPLLPGPFFGRVVLYGALTGIAAGIVSALIVAYVFSGITGSGSAAIVAFYLKLGFTLEAASLLAGLTVEPFDKTLQVLLAALLYHATPRDFLAMLQAPMPTAEAR